MEPDGLQEPIKHTFPHLFYIAVVTAVLHTHTHTHTHTGGAKKMYTHFTLLQ
jgi:hypothetical protein